METIKKNDFVELKYTGYSDKEVFDSNIEEDLKKINPEAKPSETIIIVGQGMVIPGLDKAIEEKEIGKEYNVDVPAKEGFGERNRNLVKTIPLKIFTEKGIMPRAGLVLNMDNMIARIITISGARVITDFNNPLSGKDLKYNFKIIKKITDEKKRVEVVLLLLFKFVPEFEVKDKVIIKGPKVLLPYVDYVKGKFKEMIGKDLLFEAVEKSPDKKEDAEKETKNNNK